MKRNFEILDGDGWIRLITFAADLTGEKYNGNRLVNVLRKAGWSQFTSQDYARACSVLEARYAAKAKRVPLTEEDAFLLAEQYDEGDAERLILKARLAHEYRDDKAAMNGFTASWGYRARWMVRACELFPDWLLHDSPRAKSVSDCLILFVIASLESDEDAETDYNYWCDDSSLNFFKMYQYVKDLKASKRTSDKPRYPMARRKALDQLHEMKDSAGNGKQEIIQGVIETVKEKL